MKEYWLMENGKLNTPDIKGLPEGMHGPFKSKKEAKLFAQIDIENMISTRDIESFNHWEDTFSSRYVLIEKIETYTIELKASFTSRVKVKL